MTNRALVLLVLALVGGGCACGAPSATMDPVSESWEDEQRTMTYVAEVDELDLQLEQTLSRAAETSIPPDCEQVCGLSFRICDLSERICEIAERHPDWDTTAYQCNDAQERCGIANEDTAAVCDCSQFDFESSIRI